MVVIVVVVLHTYSGSWWCCSSIEESVLRLPKDQSLRPVRMIIDASLLCVKSFIHRLQDSSCKVLLLHCHWLIVAVTYSTWGTLQKLNPKLWVSTTLPLNIHLLLRLRVCAHLRGERGCLTRQQAEVSLLCGCVAGCGLEGLDFVSEKDLVYCATATRSTFNIKLSQYTLLGASVLVQTHDLVFKFCILIFSSSFLEEEPPFFHRFRNSKSLKV